ncbi:MAG: diguanylate cyclase [Armatimonadetes bacterium]|nr:diguanylate cyclase [Armatimonadota bacterium]
MGNPFFYGEYPMLEKVLIIDDDDLVRRTLQKVLEKEGFSVSSAGSGPEAIDLARELAYDVIVCDVRMRAIKLGVDDYLYKPFEIEELLHSLKRNLDALRLFREKEEMTRKVIEAETRARYAEEIEKKNLELSLLYEVSRSLSTSIYVKEIIQVVDRTFEKILPECSRVIHLAEPREEFRGLLQDFAKNGNPSSGQGVSLCVYERLPEPYSSLSSRFPWERDYPSVLEEVRTLYVPLSVGQQLYGLLEIVPKGDVSDRNALFPLLVTLANQIALALENAVHFEYAFSMATMDGLTGLYNHRLMQELLEKELSRAKRAGESLSLLLVDIDFFKKFNDSYGHQVGDLVLKKVASTIKAGIRDGDLAARYGGEEFAVVLPSTPPAVALEVGERIRKEISAQAGNLGEASGKKPFLVTVSGGVASFPDHALSKVDLIERADSALYHAKGTGRNRIFTFEEEIPRVRKGKGLFQKGGRSLLEKIFDLEVARTLGDLIDARDAHIQGHSVKVAEYAVKVGSRLRLDHDEILALRRAGLLHDIGKIGISESILQKKGPLSPHEKEIVESHPSLSTELLERLGTFGTLIPIIYQHQEHFDGNGYPEGLKGPQIHLGARILAVVDAFVTMVEERPYRPAISLEDALTELSRNAGKQFDPIVVSALKEVLEKEKEGD